MLSEEYDTILQLLMVRYISSIKYCIENTYHPMNWILSLIKKDANEIF